MDEVFNMCFTFLPNKAISQEKREKIKTQNITNPF